MSKADNIKIYENDTINWYPGHMAAAKRMMQENMKLIDIIIELRDARIPFSSANPDIEEFTKPRIIVLSKSDLADAKKTNMWLDYFKSKEIPAIAVCSKSKQNEIFGKIDAICAQKAEYFASRGIERNIRALVAGIPNSGKSTLINSICGQVRAKTGDKPGVTRGKQWIKTPKLDLLDSPGILWPKLDDQMCAKYLSFTGAINDQVLKLEELALELIALINSLYPNALPERYKITASGTAIDDYEAICKKRGFILKGNQYDYSRCARVLLDEYRGGVLGRMTLETPNGL